MNRPKVLHRQWLLPFFVVTFFFFLWGFPNDLTNPMVEVFGKVMALSNVKAAFIQLAFYGGYATMAIPAALFIRKYHYKSGILIGLALFMIGSFLMFPAAKLISFDLFLIAFYILTFGLAFLETTANPMVMAMGDPKTSIQRLNLAQAFNPIGAISGQVVARVFVIERIETDLYSTSLTTNQEVVLHDLNVVSAPYLILGLVVLVVFLFFLKLRIKLEKPSETKLDIKHTLRILSQNANYREGVVAQFFYIACQIMVWTYIYQYVSAINQDRPDDAPLNATFYALLSTILFLCGRWVCTYLSRYFSPARLMLCFALIGACFCAGAILLDHMAGLYCLVGVSFCMSLMFPTIYGIALSDVGESAKLGSAGLILSIVGGALIPPVQAWVIDLGGPGLTDRMYLGYIPEIQLSFSLPLVCLLVVALYSIRVVNRESLRSE